MKLLTLALTSLVLLSACRTETTEEPAGSALHQIEKLLPQRAWNVIDGGKRIGAILLYADPLAPDDPSTHYFSVRNTFQQELGSLDGLGRAWKFSPHQREARLVGSGTVLEGARKILGGGVDCELVEVPLDALRVVPASARK
ncbi:MAG: hypothetical protein HZA52_19655 [Planctomycetes bacterium]|nr:hypothetical protein [Planctomycetota bacterium]